MSDAEKKARAEAEKAAKAATKAEPEVEVAPADTLYEFASTRYPRLKLWDGSRVVAEFVPDPDAEPVGDPHSGLTHRPGHFETTDTALARKVAAAEGVKGSNRAAKDLIASLK